MYRLVTIFSVLLILAASCKVQQTTSASVTQKEAEEADAPEIADTLVTITPVEIPVPDTVEIAIHSVRKDTISLIGVGDIMMGTNYPKNFLPPDSGKYLLADVIPYLEDADLTFGNLEGVILNEGGDPKNCRNPDACYAFRSPEYFAGYLKDAGFDLFSLANNHAGDFGNPGRKNTMRVLDSLGFSYAGLESCPFTVLEKDRIRYGFAAFAPNTGTISIHDTTRAKQIVAHLDSISDIVIVSFHGGAEGSKYELVPKTREYFYGEDRGDVHAFARMMIDAGADVIFGHGPHVTRSLDIYRNRIISYSLGNFCTYGRFNLRGPNGIAPILKVYTRDNGEFLYGKIIPIYQPGAGGPRIDPNNRVIKKLQELMELNFPEIKISVDDAGLISYIKSEI